MATVEVEGFCTPLIHCNIFLGLEWLRTDDDMVDVHQKSSVEAIPLLFNKLVPRRLVRFAAAALCPGMTAITILAASATTYCNNSSYQK
jgi:hypothetical protein